MSINSTARYCPFCGQAAAATWKHCPDCGMQLPQIVPILASNGTTRGADLSRSKKLDEAISYMRNEELDSAFRCLCEMLHSFPHDAEVLALLSSVCLHKYQIEQAGQYLEQARAVAPDSIFVRLKTAEYWLALGIPARAIDELSKAESYAMGNPYLLNEIRTYEKKVRVRTAGNVLRESPALPSIGFLGFLKKRQHSESNPVIKN